MGVSKEDRKAYESGKKEKEFIRDHPLLSIVGGGGHPRPDDPSKAEAYDKGLRGEQLDKDKE